MDSVSRTSSGNAGVSRSRDDESVCKPTPEQDDAARKAREKDEEARRDAWITQTPNTSGMTDRRAASRNVETRMTPVPTAAERQSWALNHTKGNDRPIKSDPVGNAIAGGIASLGVSSVVSAGTGLAEPLLHHVAVEGWAAVATEAPHVAEEMNEEEPKAKLATYPKERTVDRTVRGAKEAPSPVGKSGAGGASVPPAPANRSDAPPPADTCSSHQGPLPPPAPCLQRRIQG
jgi:hypothetical protein